MMVNVTIYSIHGSYGYSFFWLVSSLWLWCIHVHRNLMKFKVATVSDTNHPRRGQELVLVVPRGATLITGQSIPNNIKLEVSRDTPDHPTLDHDDSYWNNHSDDWGSPMKKLGRPLTPQVSGGLSNETFDQLLVFFHMEVSIAMGEPQTGWFMSIKTSIYKFYKGIFHGYV